MLVHSQACEAFASGATVDETDLWNCGACLVEEWAEQFGCEHDLLPTHNYVTSVIDQVKKDHMVLAEYLSSKCPDCDGKIYGPRHMNPTQKSWHLIIKHDGHEFVVVGCEGYFVVNPNLVGISSPNWDDWTK